ncbi:peptidoglycan bridge formation glycyltransferase FemA/FemB family protein [Candidatus Kaiserbacteria bacterium]|nr:peptidoglycan bridge formation glycyltransferase FemA/FemB family protein [Candidatus Kaiserbacteria bacterium]
MTEYLETRYGGRAILMYKGREALRLALSSVPENAAVAINGYTCWAVYQAIEESGHTCHYLDISASSLNFSAQTLRDALVANPAIKAVVVQNTLGSPCDVEAIATLCKERGIVFIEDVAHSIGTTYATGAEAGTVGDFVILSFSQDKVIDAVAGGALIIRNKKYQELTAHPKKVPFIQQLKDRLYPLLAWKIRAAHTLYIGAIVHGLFRGLRILSRPLPDAGSSEAHMLPSWYCLEILRQYMELENIARHRREIAGVYAKTLDKSLLVPTDGGTLSQSTNLRFPILISERERLIEYLKERDVYVGDIWYDAPVGPKRFLNRTDYKGQCPTAEKVARMMLNLPTHINVSTADAERIAAHVNQWLRTEGSSTYSVRPIDDEATWENFLRAEKPHSFLQSWKWAQHYEHTGSKIFRAGVYRGETLAAVALFIKIGARRGTFLVCPHGPVISGAADEESALSALARYCTHIAREEKCDFIRFCPLSEANDANRAMYGRLGFRDAPIHMHPELSWMLDITKPEDVLLKEMRKTTRYLIKKMEKEGVEIIQSSDPADMEKFASVYAATVQRQQFTPFSKEYLKTEFELFSRDGEAVFFFGKYRGELIAAAIIIFYNGQAFYHHSGSLQKFDDINASYLLQWRVIQEAKKRGCTLYNFWGIAPDNKPQHAWAGLSLFKKGFGGFAEAYLHAQDMPLTAKYWLNYVIETARRMRRRL